ncbi:MAG: tRNA (adenosine(37)-N6)-threonylcarbamoyltransferase complex transferase subunit TsaD [bacterium]|nr:tRNA (adenosine(37)-N6)-threonylcarbamoyltransferase complex transferase subunit TsaD [bacterium]
MEKILKKPFGEEKVKISTDGSGRNLIFAIESSCDESACAIVENGRKVISNVVATQIPIHQKYGGVIPEVAAREHLETINAVIAETFEQSGIKPEEITAFASTVGPGLVGCLLVGMNAAKTLSVVHNKPFIGVNHLKAHVCANYIDSDLEPPFICLLVSGGHTQIIKVESYDKQEILGETLDDAIGETYDKVARLFGIPYPGGPNLDKLAQNGNPDAFKIPKAKVGEYDFSFSGIKTHMLKLMHNLKEEHGENLPLNDVAASFQKAVCDYLVQKTKNAADKLGYKTLAVAGGVAANSQIRKLYKELQNEGYKTYAPTMKYCTDNASMVGAAAYFLSDVYTDLTTEVFSRA